MYGFTMKWIPFFFLFFIDLFGVQTTVHAYIFTGHKRMTWHVWHCYTIDIMQVRHSKNLQVSGVNTHYMIRLKGVRFSVSK